MKRTPEESAFMEHGGYRLLIIFERGVKRSRISLININRFDERLIDEALKLNLIKRASDDTESDIYYLIAERGIEIRNE